MSNGRAFAVSFCQGNAQRSTYIDANYDVLACDSLNGTLGDIRGLKTSTKTQLECSIVLANIDCHSFLSFIFLSYHFSSCFYLIYFTVSCILYTRNSVTYIYIYILVLNLIFRLLNNIVIIHNTAKRCLFPYIPDLH